MNRKEIDAERALLGSLAYADPSASSTALGELGLTEALLAAPEHRELFRVVSNTVRGGQRVRLNATLDQLSQEARKKLGGYEGLARMFAPDWLDTMPSVVELARDLKSAAHRRAMVAMFDDAKAAVLAGRVGATSQLIERLQTVVSTSELDHQQRAWKPLREVVLSKMVPALDTKEVAHRRRSGVVPTGLTRLDSLLDGGAPRSLWVLAADPGAGKTGFMVRCTLLQRALGLTVGVMPLEDPAERIYGRPVAERAQISWHTLTSREVDERTQLDAHEALKELHDAGDGIFVTEPGRVSPTEVISRLEQLYVATNGKLDIVWIDNSNEVRLEFEDHHRHMDDLLLDTRRWANERKVSVCFLTHLKRDERKEYMPIRQADLAHTAGFCRLGRLVLGCRRTEQAEEPAIAIDYVKGNEVGKFKSLFLCFAERGAMPMDREARMRPKAKKKAEKQSKLFGGGTESEAADAA